MTKCKASGATTDDPPEEFCPSSQDEYRTSFMVLPPEVRDIIYKFLYATPLEDFITSSTRSDDELFSSRIFWSPRVSIRQVCRTVYAECRELAFRNNIWHLTSKRPYPNDFTELSRTEQFAASNESRRRRNVLLKNLANLGGPCRSWITYISVAGFALDAIFDRHPVKGTQRVVEMERFPNVTHIALRSKLGYYISPVRDLAWYFPRLHVIVLVYLNESSLDMDGNKWLTTGGTVRSGWRSSVFKHMTSMEYFERQISVMCFGVDVEQMRTSDPEALRKEFGDIKHLHVYFYRRDTPQDIVLKPWHNSCPEYLRNPDDPNFRFEPIYKFEYSAQE